MTALWSGCASGGIRSRIGAILGPAELARAPDLVRSLTADPARFRAQVAAIRGESVHHLGRSGPAGAEAIAGVLRQVTAQASAPAARAG